MPLYIKPFSCRVSKAIITDSYISSSRVNLVRSQSQEHPNFFSWSRIPPPYLSVQSHACFKNSSLEISSLLIPFFFKFSTTLASVAIDAWSVPGTQHAFLPNIRALLTKISWRVLFSICPMWSNPVTLGGGITIVKGSLSLGIDLNSSFFIQYEYHFFSISMWLYLGEICINS